MWPAVQLLCADGVGFGGCLGLRAEHQKQVDSIFGKGPAHIVCGPITCLSPPLSSLRCLPSTACCRFRPHLALLLTPFPLLLSTPFSLPPPPPARDWADKVLAFSTPPARGGLEQDVAGGGEETETADSEQRESELLQSEKEMESLLTAGNEVGV